MSKKCGAKNRNGNGNGTCQSWAMSNGRCRMHGGKTPGGIADPHFKTGLHSKYLPKKLAERYNELLENPDLLNLKPDVALVRTLANRQLAQMGKEGDNNFAWVDVYKVYKKLKQSIGLESVDELEELRVIVEPNYRAVMAEKKALEYTIETSKLIDKERKQMIAEQQMITVEQALLFVTSIVMGVRKSVLKHCDKSTGRKILSDTNTAYSNAINIDSSDIAVIDG